MNFVDMLADAERRHQSLLCVGLDPEPSRFPAHLRGDASRIYDFCAAIVDATADLVLAFKPQIAYFAAHRAEAQLEKLMAHMRKAAPGVPVILDAKRGDIGSTAEQYAIEAFERYGADAVTLSPFMGFDSVEPYLRRHGKGAFLLCRTSNPGGDDLQNQRLATIDGQPLLYEHLASLARTGARSMEYQWPARSGCRRHLPGRDCPGARDCANIADADPRRGRARWRCGGHGACGPACGARWPHHRLHRRQFVSLNFVCRFRHRLCPGCTP